jgi:hypothetical protein
MKRKNIPANKGNQLVSFTHQDAQRINAAVSGYERARRGGSPSSLPRAAGGGGGGVQKCLFTGAWTILQWKQVTYAENTSATAQVQNVLFPNIAFSSAHRVCLVSGDVLISVGC